jgi:23S rRNA (adenine1618-N6)-methyltransferase
LKAPPKIRNHTKGELHPRNLHRAPYDFPRLIRCCPELAGFLVPHPLGGQTIDFARPAAVLALNRALLKHHYGVAHWTLPPDFLCPPIPGRADYLHYAADLLSNGVDATIPRGPSVKVLDIGIGANAIYPFIGARVYGWSFVGTDIDPVSIEWARQLVAANPGLSGAIECRLQSTAHAIFSHVTRPQERFALSICNPPFHASPEEAAAGASRKARNLGGKSSQPVLNFGGRSNELWCEGGEVEFVRRMIQESASRPQLCGWFSSLVSKQGSLPAIYRALQKARATEVRTIAMFAGQKQSRIVAWRFAADGQT